MTPYTDPTRLLYCDFCERSESEPVVRSHGKLPPLVMYQLDDGCMICRECFDLGADVAPDLIYDGTTGKMLGYV